MMAVVQLARAVQREVLQLENGNGGRLKRKLVARSQAARSNS